MEIKYNSYSVEEFNKKYGTSVESEMGLYHFEQQVDDDLECLAISYELNDVLNQYIKQLNRTGLVCDIVEVEGRYLAIQTGELAQR